MQTNDATSAALRSEIAKAIDEPITPATLMRIEQIAAAGRRLLQATQGRDPTEIKRPGPSNNYSSLISSTGSAFGYDAPIPASSVGAVPPYNQNETFGNVALRELQTMLKKLTDNGRTRTTVIRELAIARKAGLDDVAAELKQELDDLKIITERHEGKAPGVVADIAEHMPAPTAAAAFVPQPVTESP